MMSQALHVQSSHRLAAGRLAPQRAAPHRRSVGRQQRLVVAAGFLNFLTPKAAAPKVDERGRELAEALVELCESTSEGSKATPLMRDEIEELVSQLAPYSVKNPLKSPLLWGTYDVLYCSQPSALGGPLKKGTGPVFFPGQISQQTLEEPNVLINEIRFKSLGFLPGTARQFGEIKPLSGDTFLLSIRKGELSTGIGGPQTREFDVARKIQIPYLDESLRIARLLPDDDLEDEESEGSSLEGQPILFVFRKVQEDVEDEEEEEEEDGDDEQQPQRPKSPIGALFGGGGTRKNEGLATQAERQVRRQLRSDVDDDEEEEEEEESPRERRAREQREAAARRQAEAQARKEAQQQQKRGADDAKTVAARREAEAKEAAARKQAEIEARQRAQEEKRRAAEEARARAEEEREEQRQKQAAIRELLAELGEELRERQAETKEANAELREVQRDNGAVLRAVAAAKKGVSDAADETAEVSAALEEALAQRKAAEEALKQAQAAARQAEAEYKNKVAQALGRR